MPGKASTGDDPIFTGTFQHERETKRTHVYRELDSDTNEPHEENRDATVGSIYVKKDVTGDSPPKRVVVVIAAAE